MVDLVNETGVRRMSDDRRLSRQHDERTSEKDAPAEDDRARAAARLRPGGRIVVLRVNRSRYNGCLMFDVGDAPVRTTIAIDDDVLLTTKAIAQQQHRSLGEIVSDLARRSLVRPHPPGERNGFPLLGVRADAVPVTLETVNALRDAVPRRFFST